MNEIRGKLSILLKEDTILRRVLRNTGYMFSSQTITLVLALVQSVFAARLLGTAAFGMIGIITQFVSSVNRLFSFRMGEFVVRFLGKELNDRNIDRAGAVVKAAASTEAATSIIAYAALYLLAPLGAQYIAKDPAVTGLIRLFGLSILAQITTETANGVLQITNHFRTQAVINTIQGTFTAVMIFVAFLIKADLIVVLWAYLIGKFITGLLPILMAAIYLERHLKRGWWNAPVSLLPSFKEMMGFAFSTNLSGTVKMLSTESEALWVGYFLDPAAVGLYKIALAIVTPLMMPITPFISTTFPEITRSIVAKKWSQLKQLLRRVTLISAVWTAAVFLGMALFGRWVITVIYTAQFVGAYPALMILILGFGIANIFFWNRTLLLSFGKANIPLYVLAAAMLLKIGLSFVVVPAFGINGEAALLAGNQILSVGCLVAIGLMMIGRSEKTEPEGVAA
jgi:O-antigen/teichoic acid export membrane protein